MLTLFYLTRFSFSRWPRVRQRQLRLIGHTKTYVSWNHNSYVRTRGCLYFHRVHKLNNYAAGIYEYFTNYCRRLIVRSCRGKYKCFITHELMPVTATRVTIRTITLVIIIIIIVIVKVTNTLEARIMLFLWYYFFELKV